MAINIGTGTDFFSFPLYNIESLRKLKIIQRCKRETHGGSCLLVRSSQHKSKTTTIWGGGGVPLKYFKKWFVVCVDVIVKQKQRQHEMTQLKEAPS